MSLLSLLRRSAQRAAPAALVASSLLLFACDLDKIAGTSGEDESSGTRLNISVVGDSIVVLGGTATLSLSVPSGSSLDHTVQRWESTLPGIASVDSVTGVVQGLAIGVARITGRLLAPELGDSTFAARDIRVRYKGLSIAAIDSMTFLGQTRSVSVSGTNISDASVASVPATLTGGLSGTDTIFRISGASLVARKSGSATLTATYDGLTANLLVKVRQIVARLAYPITEVVVGSLNRDRGVPIQAFDAVDSLVPNPTIAWRVNDTSVAFINVSTGQLRAKKVDTTTIFATSDGISGAIKMRVQQVVATLSKSLGDNQTDTVAHALPVALQVTALDSGDAPVAGAEVTFRVGSGGGVITDSVRLTDLNGRASLGSWQLGPVAGEQAVIAASGTASQTFTATALPAAARKLAFSVHPSAAAIAAAIAPAIKVEIRDSLDNLVTTATNSVTLSFSTNPNPSATLGGTLTAAAVNGVATFSNVTVSAGGAGFVLLASSGTLAGAVSNSFDVFGAATKLGFVTQPVGSTAGGLMQPVRVAVQDAEGATVTTAIDNVTLTLGNAGSATLGGTRTVEAVNGVATFSDLSVSVAGTGYTLIASAPSRTGATSNAFTVSTVGTASRLAFSVQPSNSVAGSAIAPAVKVQVLDENGALVTTSTQQITLSVQDGTPLSGTFALNATSGEATFSNVIVNTAGTGLRLVASAAGTSITSATSSSFDVSPAPATKLGFVQNPTHTVAGQTMSPAVTVAVQDAQSNTITNHPATAVTVSLSGGGCTQSALSGGGPVNTVSGVATFSNIVISSQMSGCTLVAAATELSSGSSTVFASVGPNGPVKLAFTTQPTSSTTAGAAMTAGTVNFQDSNGNNVNAPQSTSVSISVLSGPGLIACCGQTSYFTSTAVTFTNITFNTAGTYRLLVSATGYDPDTSASFTVVPGPASRLGFVVQPQNTVAGVPFSNAVRVAVQDQFDNVVTGATNSIRLTASLQVSPFTGLQFNNGSFEAVESAVNGIATFSGLAVRTAASPARLHANSGDTFFGSSTNFNVTAAPLSALGFRTQPNQFIQAGATINTVEVQGQDSVGNVITTFSNPVTLTLTGGRAGALLNGTNPVTPVNGVSSFTNLSINEAASGYQLSASASGVSTGTSQNFTIQPGPATKLAWIAQPQNTFVNAPLNPATGGQLPQVAIQDQFGNLVNDGSAIRFAIANPPPGMKLFDNGSDVAFNNYHPPCNESGCSGIFTLPSSMTASAPGNAVQITASTPFQPYASATSAAFNVGAFDTKTKLVFTSAPSNTSYGVTFNPEVKVAVQDKYGNTDTTATDNITLTLSTNPTSASLSKTSQAAVKGVAAVSPLTLNKAGSGYVISASSGTLTSAVSGAFDVVTPGAIALNFFVCDMTRSGNTIYFVECSNSAKLYSVPVTGGTPQELVIGIANPARVLSDANNVYWIEFGTGTGTGAVKKYGISSGIVTTLASGLNDIQNDANTFATDGTNLYFVARNQAGTTTGIRSVPVSAGGVTTPVDVVSPGSCVGCRPFFTVASGTIFYYDFSIDAVRRISTAGGTPASVTTGGIGEVPLLTVNGTTLLLSHRTDIMTVANATTTSAVAPVTQIASGLNLQVWTVDGGFLYANNNGNLQRYSLTDFAAVTNLGMTLQTGQQSLLTDGTDAFGFICDQTGCWLKKVPK